MTDFNLINTRQHWIFDLDGTLSDPALGMVRCMNYALTKFDYSPKADGEITKFVGPPLEQVMQLITGSNDEAHITELTIAYRERYAEFGYKENSVYPGIFDMLQQLQQARIPLGVCTSKLEKYAIKVLENLELLRFFDFVSGASSAAPKAEQLEKLLHDNTIDSSALMIGDRAVDISAASSNGLASAGVLWGYGAYEELEAAAPEHLFKEPADLARQFLNGH